MRTAWYATDCSHGIRRPRHDVPALNALRRDILIPVEKILTTAAPGDRNRFAASHDSSVRGGGRERQRTEAVTALTSGSRLGKQRDQVASCFAEMVEDRLALFGTG